MPKVAFALFLGFISFFLLFFIGEPLIYHLGDVGLIPAFLVMAVFFFVCQFRLSLGNRDAYYKDWPIMLALDAVWIVALVIMILVERREVIITQGLGIIVGCFGATWAGAFAASMRAGKKRDQL